MVYQMPPWPVYSYYLGVSWRVQLVLVLVWVVERKWAWVTCHLQTQLLLLFLLPYRVFHPDNVDTQPHAAKRFPCENSEEANHFLGEKEEKKKDIANDDQAEGRHAEIQPEKQAEIYQIDMDHAAKVLSMHEEELTEVQEVVEVVTTAKLITDVVTTASAPVIAASIIILAAKPNIPAVTITAAPVKVVVASTRRRRAVVNRDPEEESFAKTSDETKSKDKGKVIIVEDPKPIKKKQQVEMDEAYARKLHEELNQDINWDVVVEHVKQKAKEDPFIQRYQVMKKMPQTEAQARRNMIMYLKNTAGFRLDCFKGMSYDDIRLIFKAKFNSNIEFLLNSKEQIEEEENRALESINETLAQ
nr:hypothetical protein [Tanacetum cinerariifolium]